MSVDDFLNAQPESPVTPDLLGMPAPPAAPTAPALPVRAQGRNPADLGALLIAALLGPGKGTGVLQGVQAAKKAHADQQQQTFNDQQKLYGDQEQVYRAQQQLYEQQGRQRQAILDTNVKALSDSVAKGAYKSKADYDTAINTFAVGLQQMGLRVNANYLRGRIPFAAPNSQKIAGQALDEWMKNPANKQLLDKNPDAAMRGSILVDIDGDGIPERKSIDEISTLAGRAFTKDANGQAMLPEKPTTAAQRADAGGYYTDLLAQAKAEGKDTESQTAAAAQLRNQLRSQAIKMASDAKPKEPKAPADKLIKVQHKDPATGQTVIEWLPESEVRGQTFEAPASATTQTRLSSAQAVNQTGNDIIAKLSNPTYARTVGPALGRYNTVREFIGNPPPEFSELAGMIESYSIANMGVHGMRSAQGAEMIRQLLDRKQTPASLIAAIKGLQGFSNHFMQNEGMPPPAVPTTPAATTGGAVPSYQEYLNRRRQP